MPTTEQNCRICGSTLVRQGRSNVWKCSKEGCAGSARDLRGEEESAAPVVILEAPKTKKEAKERLKKQKPAIIGGDILGTKFRGMTWKFDPGVTEASLKEAKAQGLEVEAEVVVVCRGVGYKYSLAEFIERLGVEV